VIESVLDLTLEEGFLVLYWYGCLQALQLRERFRPYVIAGSNLWINRPSEAPQFWEYSKHYDYEKVPSECTLRKDTHLTTNQYVFTSCGVSGNRKRLADITGCVSLF
jgi:hypothetical protein